MQPPFARMCVRTHSAQNRPRTGPDRPELVPKSTPGRPTLAWLMLGLFSFQAFPGWPKRMNAVTSFTRSANFGQSLSLAFEASGLTGPQERVPSTVDPHWGNASSVISSCSAAVVRLQRNSLRHLGVPAVPRGILHGARRRLPLTA